MDDYEAARVHLEKISTAAQKAKDHLKCSICLDLFDGPVTIKCGHRFCRQCILRVTNNENSCCPNCNTKIQKRSIPKKSETDVEACVKQFQNLIKSIQSDSGIDVLQPQNKVKHTKESTFDFEKPSTSKVQDTPSTSKGSPFNVTSKLSKLKVPNPVRSRLSLTKKKADIKSPSQSSDKNTLHKYLSNKSDPVCDQVAQSQEKVKNWLENCTSDEHDNEVTHSIQAPSKNVKDSFDTDQLTTPPEQIYSSPRGNEIQETDVSPVPPSSETSSESKYKATQMRIQEAEEIARKMKMKMSLSLKEKANLKEKSNVKTPSSVPASTHPDASDWRRVKQVGREMQVKTFKTLNVSIEKTSPAVALDDTVPYNSTNNDSKNFSRDSEKKNSSLDKTPLHMRQKDPLKSENNNLIKKSPRIVIEDYKHRSMDSSSSTKQEYDAAFNVDENQLNEIIGVVPSTSVAKTPEEVRASLKSAKRSHSSLKLNQANLSRRKSNSGQELSDDESTNCTSKAAAVGLQNSPLKKSRLSLKQPVASAVSKNSSPPGSPDKEIKSVKKSLDYSSPEKSKRRLLSGSNHQDVQNKTNNITQKLATINHPSSSNSANINTSSSKCCRIVFKKLGRICKKKKNTPFLYLGKLNKDTCVFFDGTSSIKPRPVIKSSVSVQIDLKTVMDDKTVANLEDFSSGDSISKLISPKNNLQSKSLPSNIPSESSNKCSPDNNYEEPMNVDDDLDNDRLDPSNQQMEIDETLPPAKMLVKCDSKLETMNSECNTNEKEDDKVDLSPKTSREVMEHLEEKETEEIPSSIIDKAPEPSTSTYQDSMSKKSKTKVKNCSPIPGCSSKVDAVKKSSSHIQAKVLTLKNSKEKIDLDRLPDDLISISSDDSERVLRKNNRQEVSGTKNDSSRRRGQKISKISDLESCTDSEVSAASSKRSKVNVPKQRYSSTSSSSLKTVKKKRTHSESSEDDVGNIIDKWFDNDSDKVTKKPKISFDSEEMVNVSKRRNKTKFSIESSSDEEEEVTFRENKQLQSSLIHEKVPEAKSESTEVNVNKLTAMPSSMLSADLFETNDQSMQHSIQPNAQVLKKQQHEVTDKAASPIGSDNQSDKENRSELSRENITVVDTKQLKRKKSILSKSVANEEENSQYKQIPEHNNSIKNTEEQIDEIESSQKDKNKTVDHFEQESDPYFVRESLLNVTQEQIAYKKIEKDLFGVDLSKLHENQNDEIPDSVKFSSPTTPQRKPKNTEENDDFDSDNIEATPVARKRPTFRLLSSESTPKSEINASQMFSPRRRPTLIAAITPMKNTKSYPLCHSTPMIECDSSERLDHTQVENIKIVCSSLTADNTKMVQKFVEKFNAQFQANFDMDVTHVVVKVDPETQAGPKTFKYIQGIAFKKHVVSFEWITDCLAMNKLVDTDDEKYDVLDPDSLVSGSKKSRLSSGKLFKNFAFCCLEPFDKVPPSEFKELLSYNGAVIVSSFAEFNLHKDKLKVIVVGSDEVDDESLILLNKVEAAAVYFEWVVDSLSQFQILALPSYLCETSTAKILSLGFPPELLVEEETLEEEDD